MTGPESNGQALYIALINRGVIEDDPEAVMGALDEASGDVDALRGAITQLLALTRHYAQSTCKRCRAKAAQA